MQNINLLSQYESFKQVLIHDITTKAFADIYAQTIAYGMFAARLNDPTLDNFSRQEAAELIPKSNPFLRRLFQYIAGYDLDDRIVWIVDALADIFRATNVEEMLKDFGKPTHQTDPFIHFYETFLAEYDPKLRKSRGVWYTPEPVVNFIVRAVDDILKTEFGLSQGLADTSKIRIKVPGQEKKPIEKEVHKVQILDPAAGTGTFLAEIIKHIHNKFEGQQGIWSQYVEDQLIPRINGFELLMASYAMAHLKLEMLLRSTGYRPQRDQRLRIYLTNSLEEHHPDTGTLFANWLSTEANEANHVKRDTPVMCVIGNPPYSGESANKGDWIMNLMEDYKKEPGSNGRLNERNPKWINDDYVKFLRYGQFFIERNGSGILAFINPHGFLDNPTFRGMRWNLLKTYDKIYTIDLHGNSKKGEASPNGTPDVNVFDIMQGVSINIFIKTDKKKPGELGRVFHYDLFGQREFKYAFLFNNYLRTIPYKELPAIAPNYFFVSKDFNLQREYDNGIKITDLFKLSNVGIVTARDSFTIHNSVEDIKKTILEFLSLNDEDARSKFNLGRDVRDWQVSFARKDLKDNFPDKGSYCEVSYRIFDDRWTFYTGNSRGFHCYPRYDIMQHFLKGDNVGLTLCKYYKSGDTYQHIFITKKVIESSFVSNRTSEITSVFPLYLYGKDKSQKQLEPQPEKTLNLQTDIVKGIEDHLGIGFSEQMTANEETLSPIAILDYIYSILYSPNYRERYKAFLKIDFPRVPYPKNKAVFLQLVKLGGELRQLHLLESPVLEKYTTTYPISGSNEIEKIKFEKEQAWINAEQYFGGISQVAWDFYIGGYQPAQKWLKDRKGRILSYEDIMHYQKIIVALNETDRIMKEIDKIDFLP